VAPSVAAVAIIKTVFFRNIANSYFEPLLITRTKFDGFRCRQISCWVSIFATALVTPALTMR
jgi:hypothetical protein